jgi:hypothetical protein
LALGIETAKDARSPFRRHRLGTVATRRAGDRPFVVFCSFPDSHHPLSPPAGCWDYTTQRRCGSPRRSATRIWRRLLCDRLHDPRELENLYDQPDAVQLRARLTEQLARALMDVAETGVRPAAAA